MKIGVEWSREIANGALRADSLRLIDATIFPLARLRIELRRSRSMAAHYRAMNGALTMPMIKKSFKKIRNCT
jgi:hypothetical protein